MNKQTEALKLAMEALENLPEMCGIEEAITAIRDALDEDQAHYKKVIDDVQALFDAKREQETKEKVTDKKTQVRSTEEALSTERALKLALEALENTTPTGFNMESDKRFFAAITALREALAEQPAPVAKPHEQQEPVAWKDRTYGNLHHQDFGNSIPLYASPPASKPWVGLTEEDIEAAMPGGIYDCLADPWDCGVGDGDYMRSIKNDVVRIVRAIEAKLKEKNT